MRKGIKRWTFGLLLITLLLNAVAYIHAYKFTHFTDASATRTRKPAELGFGEKVEALFLGVSNPRPANMAIPEHPYTTVTIPGDVQLECWQIDHPEPKGMMVIFHGYAADKSKMLDKSEFFYAMGFSTFLVDFQGSGGSDGNQTTIGFFESEQVRRVYDYLMENGVERIHLFGTSMGAAAILKSFDDDLYHPESLILECPFGSMYETTAARFRNMGVPTFPMADLLVFWGGVQNGFWAFSHNPAEYAAAVQCPVLLLYGEKDQNVSRAEIDAIYGQLNGPAQLRTYPESGHENYLVNSREAWEKDVADFLYLPPSKKE